MKRTYGVRMKTLLDFKPEDFVEFYRKADLKPRPYYMHVESGGCCGLGALLVEHDIDLTSSEFRYGGTGTGIIDYDKGLGALTERHGIELTRAQTGRFELGFDRSMSYDEPTTNDPYYALGFQVGKLCLEQLGPCETSE